MDVSTRWNNSHDLITAGLRMQKSVSALASREATLRNMIITEEDWRLLYMLQKDLKCFKKLSNVLCGDTYATLPSVIVSVNILLDSIEMLCHELDAKPDRNTTDERVIHAFQAGREKLLKHYDKTNWIYCAALILDSRHKLETFDKIQWRKELKSPSEEEFKRIFQTEYAILPGGKHRSVELETENDSEDE